VPADSDARFVIGLGSPIRSAMSPALDEDGQRRISERYRHHFLAREHEAPCMRRPEMLADLHAVRRLAVATGKARPGSERALEATGLRACSRRRAAPTRLPKPIPICSSCS